MVATGIGVDEGGAGLTATLPLVGVATGAWDVVVNNADGTSQTLAGAFLLHPGVGESLWVDVTSIVKRRSLSTLTVIFGNRGDVDAVAVPLTLSIPDGYTMSAPSTSHRLHHATASHGLTGTPYLR